MIVWFWWNDEDRIVSWKLPSCRPPDNEPSQSRGPGSSALPGLAYINALPVPEQPTSPSSLHPIPPPHRLRLTCLRHNCQPKLLCSCSSSSSSVPWSSQRPLPPPSARRRTTTSRPPTLRLPTAVATVVAARRGRRRRRGSNGGGGRSAPAAAAVAARGSGGGATRCSSSSGRGSTSSAGASPCCSAGTSTTCQTDRGPGRDPFPRSICFLCRVGIMPACENDQMPVESGFFFFLQFFWCVFGHE